MLGRVWRHTAVVDGDVGSNATGQEEPTTDLGHRFIGGELVMSSLQVPPSTTTACTTV